MIKQHKNTNLLKHTFLSFLVLFTLTALVWNAFGDVASAVLGPIVDCGNDPATAQDGCQVGDIFRIVRNVIEYMFTAAGVVAVGWIVYGGFLMVTSGGVPGRIESGKKAIKNALIGLAIVLISVLLVRTVFSLLKYDGNVDPLDPSTIPTRSTSEVNQGKSQDNTSSGVTTSVTPSQPSVSDDPAGGGSPVAEPNGLPGIVVWTGEDPYPSLVWSSGDASVDGKLGELRKASVDFNTAWKGQGGGELKVRQAFRPDLYQRHIRSVWEANRIIQGKSYTEGYGCEGFQHIDKNLVLGYSAEQKARLAEEVKRHASNTDTPPACKSDHALGIAVDITPPAISGGIYQKWMEVGLSVGLCHYIAGDEPHFALKKYLPANTNCLVP